MIVFLDFHTERYRISVKQCSLTGLLADGGRETVLLLYIAGGGASTCFHQVSHEVQRLLLTMSKGVYFQVIHQSKYSETFVVQTMLPQKPPSSGQILLVTLTCIKCGIISNTHIVAGRKCKNMHTCKKLPYVPFIHGVLIKMLNGCLWLRCVVDCQWLMSVVNGVVDW